MNDDIEREHTRNMVGEAVLNTRELRVKIVELFEETDTNIGDGSMALLVLAAAHLKKHDVTREEFLELCDVIYVSTEINYNGDNVTTPRIN
jgi:hypothetical protein